MNFNPILLLSGLSATTIAIAAVVSIIAFVGYKAFRNTSASTSRDNAARESLKDKMLAPKLSTSDLKRRKDKKSSANTNNDTAANLFEVLPIFSKPSKETEKLKLEEIIDGKTMTNQDS
jgi:hypothetical protein